MEWLHRVLGRVIGVAFVLPAGYFIARGKVSRRFAGGLVGIAGLIGLQGVLGWWMVQSGLDYQGLAVQDGVPRVSQYRLAAHLGTAFLVYTAMVLMALSVLRRNKFLRLDALKRTEWIQSLSSNNILQFRKSIVGLSHAIFITALSGISPQFP
jgi:heme a synthase